MKTPLVSVIVPSYNSAKTIAACLKSVCSQTYSHIEVIVVDNNSGDKTRLIAKKYTSHVYIHGPERSAQINFGAQKARGKYLYRVDSDFILDPTVIEECVRTCEKDRLDGIAVHNTSAEGLGFWAEVRKYERNTYRDDNLIVAVRFFTKKSWEAIGGFDEGLYGPEDYDFHNRFVAKGFRWGRIHAIERHLGEPKSLQDIWKKHYFYGQHMVAYLKKHPSIGLKQLNPMRSSYVRHWSIFLEHPIIALGLGIMTIVKFTAGGLGFFSVWIKPQDPSSQVKFLYGGLGQVSVFTRIRFWTGSFTQVEKYVPREGKILDLGCGYGIFANFLALCSSKRNVLGIDTDANKIKFADRKVLNTSFRVGDATKMHVGSFDAILLLDVLHHLNSYADQEKLIDSCVTMLKSGGKLCIVDVHNDPLWKLALARLTDAVMYPGQPVFYRYKSSMLSLLRRRFGKTRVVCHALSYNPFPHLIYICQKK